MNVDPLVTRCTDTHQQWIVAASRTVDTQVGARNYLFGRYNVQFEQSGADRAYSGKRMIKAELPVDVGTENAS